MATRDLHILANRDFLAPVPDSVLLNLSNVHDDASPSSSSGKPRTTLFGPLLEQPRGSGPAMNKKPLPVEKRVVPADVVQGWVEKSKDTTQSTTTLQALVNLKTSSLRLFPLSVPSEDSLDGTSNTNTNIAQHDAPHSLEFQYDCDAPKCRISLDVYSKKRPDGKSSKTTVYSSVFEGGFGRSLKVEDGATLELSHIVSSLQLDTTDDHAQPSTSAGAGLSVVPVTPAHDQGEVATGPETASAPTGARKRLSAFAFKRRHQRSDVAGPALRVVDVDAVTEPLALDKQLNKTDVNVNIRVSITLEALDEQENSLKAPNLQSTRLSIIRAGHPASDIEEDTRHWTVQVVRRDATIGAHTFRLQDIYGLSSHAKSPAVPPPATPTTYPPVIGAAATGTNDDDVSSECVLCLSAPREVVLLPCRHLVACKDCAINMVEYGAGGQLVHPAEETEAAGGVADPVVPGETPAESSDAAGGANGGDTEAVATNQPPVVAAAASIPRPPRRKRRPKGWHCPVCRQPYTSMLRISTAGHGKEDPNLNPVPVLPASPNKQSVGTNLSNMLSSARPGFLRGLSRNPPPAQQTTGVDHPLQSGLSEETV